MVMEYDDVVAVRGEDTGTPSAPSSVTGKSLEAVRRRT
jgi:hypothetical protein